MLTNSCAAVAVVPTLKRPEMLALSLERLKAAIKQSPIPVDVQVYLDDCTPERVVEVEYVISEYFPTATLFQSEKHVYAPSGCYNILAALKGGFKSGQDFVFLVEEDVMVAPTFFEKHLEMHGIGSFFGQSLIFASCGRLIDRYGPGYYTNPGACFHRSILSLIVPHINDAFFADRRGYLNRVFTPFEEASDLDDGLIRHVHRQSGLPLRFPDKPIVAHQGFHAYGKYAGYKTEGTIQERIQQLREMLPTVDPNGRYTRDFEPYGIPGSTEIL